MNRDSTRDYLVVVPTMGSPDTLVPTFRRLLDHLDGTRTQVVLVVNPSDPAAAAAALEQVKALKVPEGVAVALDVHEGPLGFAKACNAGLRVAERGAGVPRLTVFLNDDTEVTAGWLPGLLAALESPTIRLWGDPTCADYPTAKHGRLGITGPASDCVAGVQSIELKPEARALSADAFAHQYRKANIGNYIACDFISGFCMGVLDDCLADIGIRSDAGELVGLFDPAFRIGGYEDNDVCVRAEFSGWRCVVAGDVFVRHLGHRTLDRHFPGQRRGLANRVAYYRKWAPITQRRQHLGAVLRVKVEVAQDLRYLQACLLRLGQLVDSVSVLLTNNPLEVTQAEDWRAVEPSLQAVDKVMLRACSGADAAGVGRAFGDWVTACTGGESDSRKPQVACRVWEGLWNERDERNAAIAMAEATFAPDWLLSVDADEVVEPRVKRGHFERLMTHPDPMVRAWDFGWVNHWDSPRLARQDGPWGDMRGFRLWRVNHVAPRRILAGNAIGLHCGNCPDHDPLAKRVSNVRFRHYGYARAFDRKRKFERYQKLDPSPDRRLTGGGYAHLIDEENMRISAFIAENGIGLHMLAYEGEEPHAVAGWLDTLHGMVDAAVLVWTGDWDGGPGGGGYRVSPTLLGDTCLLTPPPDSGPGRDLWDAAQLFGAAWVHQPLQDDMSGARNAGLRHLEALGLDGMGWALFFDPDEFLSSPFADCLAIRRAAEVGDSWGWLLKAENVMPDGEVSQSESIRMSRLTEEMRFSGRIHEGFHNSWQALKAKGVNPRQKYFPFVLYNPGLALPDDLMEQKLQRYTRMLRLELQDDPRNGGAWVSLGLQYLNDGHVAEAQTCFERAVLVDHDSYLGFRELAIHHFRVATGFMDAARQHLSPVHPYAKIADEAVRLGRMVAPMPSRLGLARRKDHDPGPPAPLPDLPADLVTAQPAVDSATIPAGGQP